MPVLSSTTPEGREPHAQCPVSPIISTRDTFGWDMPGSNALIPRSAIRLLLQALQGLLQRVRRALTRLRVAGLADCSQCGLGLGYGVVSQMLLSDALALS